MQIARFARIPLRVDWSWLLVFGLLLWTLAAPGGPFNVLPAAFRLPVTAIVVCILFACVVAHEFAHALTARRFGVQTREIDLFVFGGVSQMEGAPQTPAQAALIAAAGPCASTAIAGLFAAAAMSAAAQSMAQIALAYLCAINLVLAAFNLLPAYPMDGGRIFAALVWRITGDRARAARVAAGTTTIAGMLLAGIGLAVIARGGLLAGMWIAVIAWFIMRAAQVESSNEAAAPLAELDAGSVADPPPAPIEPDITCEAALDRMVRTRQRAIPVCIGPRLLGLVTLSDFAKLKERAPGSAYVTAIMTPAERLLTLTQEEPALEAFKRLAQSGYRQLPVLDADGHLTGLVNHETVARALAFGMERGPAAGPVLSRRD